MYSPFLQQPQMAPFSFPNPFRSAHGMNNGQQTPPSSPESQEICLKQKESRLPFSKFLRKSRPTKPTFQAAPMLTDSRSCYGAQTIRAREFSNPMAFLTPNSPTLTTLKSRSECDPAPELRRRSFDYTDLRAVAQQQQELKVSRLPTPLLSSPLQLDEPLTPSTSYFDLNSMPGGVKNTEDTAEPYATYEDLRILSCYYENSALYDDMESPGGEWNQWDDEKDYYDEPSQLPDRSTLCSIESDWFAATKTYDERLRRFRQRCFQVVQKPMSSGVTIREDGGHEIKLATVLVGPGKPKIVQIQRPASFSTASKSSLNVALVPKTPETPRRAIREVSAFSPYDTPMNHADMQALDTPLSTRRHSKQSTLTTDSLVPKPLSPKCHGFARVDSAVAMEVGHSKIYCNPSLSDSQFTLTSITTVSTPRLQSPRSSISPTMEAETSWRCWKLERTLDAVTQAVESFPNGILRLESPAILELRHSSITDEIHISCLQKIFPQAATLLLSALAAWLIFDLHFMRLDLDAVEAKHLNPATASNESLHSIPAKARETLGITLSERMNMQNRERMLRNRARVVQMSVEVIGRRLMEALRGRWDEDLWRSLRVLVEVVETGHGRMA